MATAPLSSASLQQHNTVTGDDEKEFPYEIKKSESNLTDITSVSDAEEKEYDHEPRGLIKDILFTENDLAGFSIIWCCGLVIVAMLRILEHGDVINANWLSIISLPFLISVLTWIFSYILTIYRKIDSSESMKQVVFVVPFAAKSVIATIFFSRLMYAEGGFRERFKHEDNYGNWCDWVLISVLIALILSVILTEIIITTVMVNSAQNLNKVPKYIDLFLFITRPVLWVYNRLIVMFITFYAFHYIFLIGPLCVSQCKVKDVSKLETVGLNTLILPFNDLFYLFHAHDFSLKSYNNSSETMVAVIQQVLIFTTIFDLLMDCWSVWQIFKRDGIQDIERVTKKVRSISQTLNLTGKTTQLKPSAMKSIQEEDDVMERMTSNESEPP